MPDRAWWRRGVIYNAYPRSWQDSDGDGTGDLRGIVQRLDYLEWLGATGLWLNPIMPSPNDDWGYDVTDYCDVHPDFGSIDDLDELVAQGASRGIRILLDMVPSHTSSEHPWFEAARSSPGSRFRDFYVWRPGRRDGLPPTNWLNFVDEPAWTFDERAGEYFLHNYSPQQPQLNWWNPAVAAEFERIFRFWFDRGVAGFRIDSLQTLFYDRELRDNPPAGGDESDRERRLGQRFEFNANRPEVHGVIRRWRTMAEGYDPPRLLFGETWVSSTEGLAAYYGNGQDELHLAWNVPFLRAQFAAAALSTVIERTLDLLPPGATPTWAMSTHDGEGRAASRWCGGEERAIRCALVVLLALAGTPIIYYGDEIGMLDVAEEVLAAHHRERSDHRDAARGPMQWERRLGAGFTSGDPWLPVGDAANANVTDQLDDPDSMLHLCRDLIRLHGELADQEMTAIPSPDGVLAWRLGDATVAINLGHRRTDVSATGIITLCTRRSREGESVERSVRLAPGEALVVR